MLRLVIDRWFSQLKETADKGVQKAITVAPVPPHRPSIPSPATLRIPEILDRPAPVPQPAPSSNSAPMFTPKRFLAALAQTPSSFTPPHPSPFRPPGLDYQPSRYTPVGPGPGPGPGVVPPHPYLTAT